MHERCIALVTTRAELALQKHQMEREIAVLLTLRHPNIVSVYGFVRVAATNSLIMIMDMASAGALSRVLQRAATSPGGGLVAIPWAKRLEILTGIAAGVEFLHSQASMPRERNSFRASPHSPPPLYGGYAACA